MANNRLTLQQTAKAVNKGKTNKTNVWIYEQLCMCRALEAFWFTSR